MKNFCKLTAQSPAASYVPLPRFLLQDETLWDISNDAKVLYALLLDRASISRQNGYVEPDGSLFRLTPGQLRSVRGLTKRCCNFSGGDCLLLDGVCPQHISRSLLCRRFRRAVLPQLPKLEQSILSPKKLHRCAVCGTGILARSGRAKYCPTCAKNIHRQQKAKSARKRRSGVYNSVGRKALEWQVFPHRRSRTAIRFPSYPRNRLLFVYISTTKGDISMDNILTVPIHLKMTLTAREAAEYSNIGINKIDSMLRSPNCPFVLFVGTKKLVKRREFEQYISRTMAI